MKIVINTCFGGFGLSEGALNRYNELSETPQEYGFNIKRTDPILIQVVEELGKLANDRYSALKVVEIPDDVQYTIEEYDGAEHIAEVHRTWE